jgi:hypothetical protein
MKTEKSNAPEATPDSPHEGLLELEYHDASSKHGARKFIHHAKILVGLAFLAVICANLYVALNYQLKASSVKKTVALAGVGVVNADKQAAAKKLASSAKVQKINIIINGTAHTYSAKDLGIVRDYSTLLDDAYPPPDTLMNKLNSKKTTPTLKTYVQKGRLISSVESQLGQYKTAVDASVAVGGGTLVVNPSKAGINIDFNQMIKQLNQSDLRPNLTITAALTMRDPEILTAAAEAAKSQAEEIIAPAYGISTDSNGTRYASAAQKASWLIFTPNKTTLKIDVSLNATLAKGTIAKIAQSFVQPIKPKITLTGTDGSVSIIDNGQAGIALDQSSINDGLDQFDTALTTGQAYSLPLKLVVQPQGEKNLGTATGGKFVLVDKADFKAWAIDGSIVERTMVVSTGRPGLETPSGHFTILRKTRLTTMKGCNSLVGCWVVPNVPNAQFFASNGDALHGTYWYVNWGHQNLSHGCVNLQLADAAWLYDWTVVGTDVVVV